MDEEQAFMRRITLEKLTINKILSFRFSSKLLVSQIDFF